MLNGSHWTTAFLALLSCPVGAGFTGSNSVSRLHLNNHPMLGPNPTSLSKIQPQSPSFSSLNNDAIGFAISNRSAPNQGLHMMNILPTEPPSEESVEPISVGSKRFNKQIDGKPYHVTSVYGRVQLKAPYDEVLAFVKNIENLDRYEPKLSRVKHLKAPDNDNPKGYYQSTGVFMFVPFRDTFSYVDRKDGFHSEMESGLLKNHMNGGFKVKPISDTVTEVYHYEVYEFNRWKNIMPKRVEHYLKEAMHKELEDLANVYQESLPL